MPGHDGREQVIAAKGNQMKKLILIAALATHTSPCLAQVLNDKNEGFTMAMAEVVNESGQCSWRVKIGLLKATMSLLGVQTDGYEFRYGYDLGKLYFQYKMGEDSAATCRHLRQFFIDADVEDKYPASADAGSANAGRASAKPSCRTEWRNCSDNVQMAREYVPWDSIRIDCRFSATRGALHGDPEWPSSAFEEFRKGNDFSKTGLAFLAEPNAHFHTAAGEMVPTRVDCVYDLDQGAVLDIKVTLSPPAPSSTSAPTPQAELPRCIATAAPTTWTGCPGTLPFSGGTFSGILRDGKPNGPGTLTLSSGDKYVGDFRDGLAVGKVVMTLSTGTIIGEFHDGKITGTATLTLPTGEKYVGEIRDNQLTGQGIMTLPSGETYRGEFRNNKPNGQGTLLSPNGTKYVGEFRDSKRSGQGTEYLASGAIGRSGLWVNDVFVGAAAAGGREADAPKQAEDAPPIANPKPSVVQVHPGPKQPEDAPIANPKPSGFQAHGGPGKTPIKPGKKPIKKARRPALDPDRVRPLW
jgi:hypothetical protein